MTHFLLAVHGPPARPEVPSARLGFMDGDRDRFIATVLENPVIRAVLDRAPELDVPDWWLVAGALFQTVWNLIDGRDPSAGIRDYDLFYFNADDLSWEAEDEVIRRAEALFGDLDAVVEVRNEARVHLWYEDHYGVPAPPFTSSRNAVDHFASTTCCYGIARDRSGHIEVYAPHGYADLFERRVRPNPLLATRDVYELKTDRWLNEWPGLIIEPWPDPVAT